MEKIYKLLTSKIEGDIRIGLHLLVASEEAHIVKIFKQYARSTQRKNYTHWDMSIGYHKQLFYNYIEVSNNYLICHFTDGDLRLRKRETDGWGDGWPVLSKENFLNGVY